MQRIRMQAAAALADFNAATGMHNLCFGEVGFRHFSTGKTQIRSPKDLAGLKILVIDDSKTIRRTAETLLAAPGNSPVLSPKPPQGWNRTAAWEEERRAAVTDIRKPAVQKPHCRA